MAVARTSEDLSSEENSLQGEQKYLGFWKALLIMVAMYLSAFLVALVRYDLDIIFGKGC